jgi:hypothetical protein
MDHSVVMPLAKHLPERRKEFEKVEEGIISTLGHPTQADT